MNKKRFDYVATSANHLGVGGRWTSPTVRGAMALADRHAHPSSRVTVSAAYTSDGTFFGEGRGRVMAQRGGDGRWMVEAYHDANTEAVREHGEPWRRKADRDRARTRRDERFPTSAGPWFDVHFENRSAAARFAKGVREKLGYRAIVSETDPLVVVTNIERWEGSELVVKLGLRSRSAPIRYERHSERDARRRARVPRRATRRSRRP